MLKKMDRKIISYLVLAVMLSSLFITSFATSYSSYFTIYGGNQLNGITRTYTGDTIGIEFDATISGTSIPGHGCNVVQPVENVLGLKRYLSSRLVSPTSVDETWEMDGGNTITSTFYFYFWNAYTGTWASSNVSMYSN